MALKFDIRGDAGTPIFQQIVQGFERLILSGTLKEGDFLPSVREFAVGHAINPNTVARAYQTLQSDGLVESVRGTGLRVTRLRRDRASDRKEELLRDKIEELLSLAQSLGIGREEIIERMRGRRSE